MFAINNQFPAPTLVFHDQQVVTLTFHKLSQTSSFLKSKYFYKDIFIFCKDLNEKKRKKRRNGIKVVRFHPKVCKKVEAYGPDLTLKGPCVFVIRLAYVCTMTWAMRRSPSTGTECSRPEVHGWTVFPWYRNVPFNQENFSPISK